MAAGTQAGLHRLSVRSLPVPQVDVVDSDPAIIGLRIEFRVDTRNTRSCRAVEKLGCTRDGVLRANRRTWTGFVRDTAVYSLLPGEWR